ncbi:WD40-repeat-containing domain protein [Mycena crocata]|nr:WD40-repeat-containing domain protein [Mycena crocata]
MTSNSTPFFKREKILHGHGDTINAIAFSPDGKLLASGGDDARLVIHHVKSWREQKKIESVAPIRAVVWYPNHPGFLAFGMRNGVITTLQLKNNVTFENKVIGSIHCMAVNTDGKYLAVGFNDEVMIARLSSLSSWTSERHVPRPPHVHNVEDVTRSVNFHHTDKLILVSYLYRGVVAYDYTDPSFNAKWNVPFSAMWYFIVSQRTPFGQPQFLRSGESALSPTSRLLVSTTILEGVQWLDITRRSISSVTELNANILLPVTFISNNVIAVGSATGEVAIYKSGMENSTQILSHNQEMVQSLALVGLDVASKLQAFFHDKKRGLHFLITGIAEQYEESVLTVWKAKDVAPKFAVHFQFQCIETPFTSFQIPWRPLLATATSGIILARYAASIYTSLRAIPAIWREIALQRGPETVVKTSDAATVTEMYTQVVTQTVHESTESVTPFVYESAVVVEGQ